MGTGDVVEAVRHTRRTQGEIRRLQSMDEDELYVFAKEIRAPIELVRQTRDLGRACGELRGWRRRHPGRRCADDAARRGWRLRRERYFQVWCPREEGEGHRPGHHPLQ